MSGETDARRRAREAPGRIDSTVTLRHPSPGHSNDPRYRLGAAYIELELHVFRQRRLEPRLPHPGEAGTRRPRRQMGPAVGSHGHLPLRSGCRTRRRPGRALLRRHSSPDRVRQPAHRARVQLHPHGPGHPVPAHARQAHLLSDGMGRQRPAHRAPGAELLRRALRPDSGLRRRVRSPAAGWRQRVIQGGRPAADLATQLHRALRDPHR